MTLTSKGKSILVSGYWIVYSYCIGLVGYKVLFKKVDNYIIHQLVHIMCFNIKYPIVFIFFFQ